MYAFQLCFLPCLKVQALCSEISLLSHPLLWMEFHFSLRNIFLDPFLASPRIFCRRHTSDPGEIHTRPGLSSALRVSLSSKFSAPIPITSRSCHQRCALSTFFSECCLLLSSILIIKGSHHLKTPATALASNNPLHHCYLKFYCQSFTLGY